MGTFIDPNTGNTFQGCDNVHRNNLIDSMGYSAMIKAYEFCESVNKNVRDYYTYGEDARHWSNVSSKWKSDCAEYGVKAADIIVSALDNIPKTVVKERILKMAGLNYEEELLLVGQGKYLCSLFSEKYGAMLKRANSDECVVEYVTNKKGVLFTLRDSVGVIVSIEVLLHYRRMVLCIFLRQSILVHSIMQRRELIWFMVNDAPRNPKRLTLLSTPI